METLGNKKNKASVYNVGHVLKTIFYNKSCISYITIHLEHKQDIAQINSLQAVIINIVKFQYSKGTLLCVQS